MRFISTKTHAVNDYIFGALLILIPLLYLEEGGGPAVWVPVVIGTALLLQSLVTNYEFSAANLIPVKAHLGLDALAGFLLAISPWAFGFSERVWAPHLIVGLIEIGFALTTRLHRDAPRQHQATPRHATSP